MLRSKRKNVLRWSYLSKQRDFFDEIGEKLGILEWEDWYKVTKQQVIEHGGGGLLKFHYRDSLTAALVNIYSEYDWKIWKFNHVPPGYWSEKKSRRQFFEDISKTLNIKTFSDWYNIDVSTVVNLGGRGLLSYYYGNSLYKALSNLFPEFSFHPWKFSHGYWDDERNIKEVIEIAAKELQVNELDEWKSITSLQLSLLGLKTLIDRYGGVISLLSKLYPNHNWDTSSSNASSNGSKSQRFMFKLLQNLFPGKDLHLNYPVPNLHEHKEIEKKEIDVFIPSLNLAFEYQGLQHYQSYFLNSSNDQRQRDEEKRNILKKAEITLIEIPYWWDMKEETLISYIRKHRADLFTEYAANDNKSPIISQRLKHDLQNTSLHSIVQLHSPITLDISLYTKNST